MLQAACMLQARASAGRSCDHFQCFVRMVPTMCAWNPPQAWQERHRDLCIDLWSQSVAHGRNNALHDAWDVRHVPAHAESVCAHSRSDRALILSHCDSAIRHTTSLRVAYHRRTRACGALSRPPLSGQLTSMLPSNDYTSLFPLLHLPLCSLPAPEHGRAEAASLPTRC